MIEKFSSSFFSTVSGIFLVMSIKNFFEFVFIILLLTITSNNAYSLNKNKYLATKYDEVNVRIGPGLNNLVIFKILKKGYPLQITEQYDNWFQVEDFNGRNGWVSKTQLTDDRGVIVITDSEKIFKFPNHNSKVLAIVKKSYVLSLSKCRKKWCKVFERNITGWVSRNSLWGDDD